MSNKNNWIPKEMEKTVATGLASLLFGVIVNIGLFFGELSGGVKFEVWKEKNRRTYSTECYDSLGNKVRLLRYDGPVTLCEIEEDPAICSCNYVEKLLNPYSDNVFQSR